MADNARKKEKQRLKRKQKQLSLRRAQSISPTVKIGRTGGTLECWVNEGWKEDGMADVMVLGHAGGGNYVAAVFLIDTWCVGLKDAWGRIDISRGDFEEKMLKKARAQMSIVKLDVDEARRLLAGSISFSRRNGFRLPPHYERWTAIFGNLGDIASADISGFGVDGKLRYVGTIDFLRQRLIASSPQEFTSRKDVEVIMHVGSSHSMETMGGDDGDADDEDEQDVDDSNVPPQVVLDEISRASAELVERTESWCVANGVPPQPFLDRAARVLVTATVGAVMPGSKSPDLNSIRENVGYILKLHDEQARAGIREALAQIDEMNEGTPVPIREIAG